ncbi:MAG: hypothetical protein CMB63_03290 [Euryarchaeota archaeon]|nr:hypothetical protein [Euryarchaeota archaeon]
MRISMQHGPMAFICTLLMLLMAGQQGLMLDDIREDRSESSPNQNISSIAIVQNPPVSKADSVVAHGNDVYYFSARAQTDSAGGGAEVPRLIIANSTAVLYDDPVEYSRSAPDEAGSQASVTTMLAASSERIYFASTLCAIGKFGSWNPPNSVKCTNYGHDSDGSIVEFGYVDLVSNHVIRLGTMTYGLCSGGHSSAHSPYTAHISMTEHGSNASYVFFHTNGGAGSCKVYIDGLEVDTINTGNGEAQRTILASLSLNQSSSNESLVYNGYEGVRSSNLFHFPGLRLAGKSIIRGNDYGTFFCHDIDSMDQIGHIQLSGSNLRLNGDHLPVYPSGWNATILGGNSDTHIIDENCNHVKSWNYTQSNLPFDGGAKEKFHMYPISDRLVFIGTNEHNTNISVFDVNITPNSDYIIHTDLNGAPLGHRLIPLLHDEWRNLNYRFSEERDISSWTTPRKSAFNATMMTSECTYTALDSCQSMVTSIGLFDEDEDSVPDVLDVFPGIGTQWADADLDGFGDNPLGHEPDDCLNLPGNSTLDRYGCVDADGDGWSNQGDVFPTDGTQWADSDFDGYGDQPGGTRGDHCPAVYGESFRDMRGCVDSDGDGWSDANDDFPDDPTQNRDTDEDGFGDSPIGMNADGCIEVSGTSTQDVFGCPDSDGDGWSDTGDPFPDDPAHWSDSDMDGSPDEIDAFPNDPTQSADTDGDGFGDDPFGNRPDMFPDDSSEWYDFDGDEVGNNADDFPLDPTQWEDADGDGYGDNVFGINHDAFPADETQWEDADGDGYGDNPNGNNPDPYLNDYDNDGFPDSEDILPFLYSPGDQDADGCPDLIDRFPTNPRECLDNDNDGIGDNSDPDDDNDGWNDIDEERLGYLPFDNTSVPVDTWEIVVPGTSIGLSAWDLIGIFGGVPIAFWLIFSLLTRNARTSMYTTMIDGATSRSELDKIARRWEFALQIRLIGPHHGIRLERLRAERDDILERFEIGIEDVDHTSLVIHELDD